MKFEVKKGKGVLEGTLFLQSNYGHCHGTSSVKSLLESDRFQNSNSELVPIYEKALKMMQAGQTGPVVVEGNPLDKY